MSQAIVYTSNTGFTKKYAELLAARTGLPVCDLEQAAHSLPAGARIIYLGWLMAGKIQGYQKAAKVFRIDAAVGVGMAPDGVLTEQVRKANGLDTALPLFTLQGGYDRRRVRGIYRFMMDMLMKKMTRDQAKKEPTEADRQMLQMMRDGGDWVREAGLQPILDWYSGIN